MLDEPVRRALALIVVLLVLALPRARADASQPCDEDPERNRRGVSRERKHTGETVANAGHPPARSAAATPAERREIWDKDEQPGRDRGSYHGEQCKESGDAHGRHPFD
jgi:hypothetical protein